MGITRQTYRVWYDDDTHVDVVCDQRDVAAFERAAGVGFAKAQDLMMVIAMRNVAYQALRRTGKLPQLGMKVEQWDVLVIEVEPLRDEEPVDPTPAEVSATGPSVPLSTPA